MSDRINKDEIVRRVAQRTGQDAGLVTEIVDVALDEIYLALKQGESVTLRDFGSFYVREKGDSWVFKFKPSQKWRKLFGWSSTYRGEP